MDTQKIDIAIVGGGVSGVYSAWRLKTAEPKKNIVVFEGSDHIGGRLLSVSPPDNPNLVAELGGMRILPAVQPIVGNLISALNKLLPEGQKIELYNFPVDQPQNIAFLRGIHLRLSDFTSNPDKIPYRLSYLERGWTTGKLILNAIEQIVPGITNPKLTGQQRMEMASNAEFNGTPLYKQGFWNVLMQVISGEAYQLGVDSGGYSSTLTNWNAADAIPWYLSDFGIDPVYKAFKKGFQQVPKTLADMFKDAGGEIRLNSKLVGFDWKDGRFELKMKDRVILADHLILAMPKRALDLISPHSAPLREAHVAELITSVTPRPLFKLFTTYTNPWWLAAGYTNTETGKFVSVKAGRTVTDLPVRQTYYWPQNTGDPVTSGPAMLMASYDDGSNVGFWDSYRPRRRTAWKAGLEVAKIEEPFIGSDAGNGIWDQYKAPAKMVSEVVRQLAKIHDLNYMPEVKNAAFRDWGDDPFGGGWNSWNIGVKSAEVLRQIVRPSATMPLFICGEAYSDYQGWVEGALQTADLVLKNFGLKPLEGNGDPESGTKVS